MDYKLVINGEYVLQKKWNLTAANLKKFKAILDDDFEEAETALDETGLGESLFFDYRGFLCNDKFQFKIYDEGDNLILDSQNIETFSIENGKDIKPKGKLTNLVEKYSGFYDDSLGDVDFYLYDIEEELTKDNIKVVLHQPERASDIITKITVNGEEVDLQDEDVLIEALEDLNPEPNWCNFQINEDGCPISKW